MKKSQAETVSWEGVLREESWATALLVMSVLALCALMLYTVIRFCSWLKPTLKRGKTLLPWLEMPLMLGLMLLTGVGIAAAVPLNDASCRLLLLGPSFGYTLVSAGLLTRIIQHLFQPHVFLQWLLFCFVALNQCVIGVTYILRTDECLLTVQQQLLMLIYAGVLVAVVLILVFRTARRRSRKKKLHELIYIGLAASFSGAIGGCWIGAATVLTDELLPSCLGYGCLLTVVVLSMILFIPRKDVFDDGVYIDRGVHGGHSSKPIPVGQEELEIIVVPVSPDGETGRRDIAGKAAIRAHSGLHHRRHHQRTRSLKRSKEPEPREQRQPREPREPREAREPREFRELPALPESPSVSPQYQRRQHSRPHRWNNKIQVDSLRRRSSKKEHQHRRRDRPMRQTPDDWQAWLY